MAVSRQAVKGETTQRYRTALGDVVTSRYCYDVRLERIVEHVVLDGKDVDLRGTAAQGAAVKRP
jgi:hypothetical protein